MLNRTQIYADYSPWSASVDVRIVQQRADDQFHAIAQPLQFVHRDETAIGQQIAPCFSLGAEAAQSFMDSLWMCGFRPTEGSGSAGALRAVEKHLADMRAIAFKGLDLDAPTR